MYGSDVLHVGRQPVIQILAERPHELDHRRVVIVEPEVSHCAVEASVVIATLRAPANRETETRVRGDRICTVNALLKQYVLGHAVLKYCSNETLMQYLGNTVLKL